jgi:hypothetical protein
MSRLNYKIFAVINFLLHRSVHNRESDIQGD